MRAGTLRALAIAAKKRSPMLPDVPTSYEQGLPEFDCAPFYAVFAPKGTPQPIVDKLAEALNKGLSEEGRAEAAGRSRRRHCRTQSPWTEGTRRTGKKRNRAADADPESRNCELSMRISAVTTDKIYFGYMTLVGCAIGILSIMAPQIQDFTIKPYFWVLIAVALFDVGTYALRQYLPGTMLATPARLLGFVIGIVLMVVIPQLAGAPVRYF